MDHLWYRVVSLEVKTACLARFFPPWTVQREIWTEALKPCNSGISTDVLLLCANWVTPLSTIIGCSVGCPPHVSLRKDYLTRLRVFVSHVSAMDCCGQCSDTGFSSPAPASSGSPRSSRQRDMGAESPCKTRRTSRRVRPTQVQHMLAGVLLPVAVSDQAPGAIIYDCCTPILPVTVRLWGLRGPCVIRPTASSSLTAPPEGEDLVAGASVPGSSAVIQSVLSDDPGTDFEDELCHFSPLQETISPLPESGDDIPMSLSRYPAPPGPAMDISVMETPVSRGW